MTFHEQLTRLEAYLDAKRAARDWHGVRDACVDIEVLEACVRERKEAIRTTEAIAKVELDMVRRKLTPALVQHTFPYSCVKGSSHLGPCVPYDAKAHEACYP